VRSAAKTHRSASEAGTGTTRNAPNQREPLGGTADCAAAWMALDGWSSGQQLAEHRALDRGHPWSPTLCQTQAWSGFEVRAIDDVVQRLVQTII
jgi:hypothetical protein